MRTPKEEREIHAGGYVWNEDGTRAERMKVFVSDSLYELADGNNCHIGWRWVKE